MVTGQGGIPGQTFACLELKNEASLHAYSTSHAALAQRVEAAASKPAQSEFESRGRHNASAWVVQAGYADAQP